MLAAMRAFIRLAVLLAILGCGLTGLWLAWVTVRDPFAALPKPQGVRLTGSRTVETETRTLNYLTLHDPGVGETRVILSLPRPAPEEPVPLMVVLGGLPSAEDNLRHTPDPGPNALILYDWPFDPYLPEDLGKLALRLPHLYRRSSRMPGQIAAATLWAKEQPRIDGSRVNLLGFSLGALSVPAAQRILEHQGVPVYATLLAYGGTPVSDLLIEHPSLQEKPFKPVIRWTGHLFTRHLDPDAHLPYLEGRFLVIYGEEDDMVPPPAARRLAELTPEPKTVVVLPGRHMGVGEEERATLRRIAAISRQWLLAQGAVERFTPHDRSPGK